MCRPPLPRVWLHVGACVCVKEKKRKTQTRAVPQPRSCSIVVSYFDTCHAHLQQQPHPSAPLIALLYNPTHTKHFTSTNHIDSTDTSPRLSFRTCPPPILPRESRRRSPGPPPRSRSTSSLSPTRESRVLTPPRPSFSGLSRIWRCTRNLLWFGFGW